MGGNFYTPAYGVLLAAVAAAEMRAVSDDAAPRRAPEPVRKPFVGEADLSIRQQRRAAERAARKRGR